MIIFQIHWSWNIGSHATCQYFYSSSHLQGPGQRSGHLHVHHRQEPRGLHQPRPAPDVQDDSDGAGDPGAGAQGEGGETKACTGSQGSRLNFTQYLNCDEIMTTNPCISVFKFQMKLN